MNDILDILSCLLCGRSLDRVSGSLRCGNGHSFDIARSGYVNLLPPGKEKNARSGDEREMVRARESFLSLGYYDSIADTLAGLVTEYSPDSCKSSCTVCDMGCGEGYHTCRTIEHLSELCDGELLAVGFDASKYAAERASKRAVREGLMPRDGVGAAHDKGAAAYFFPGNLFRLPLADSSVNVALSLFAPVAGDEAARILKNDGLLIVVSSGREHLLELRRRIYEDVRLSDELPPVPSGFRELGRRHSTEVVSIRTTEELRALFTMTPFYYKTTEQGRERLLSSEMPFRLTVDVDYSIFGVL